MVDFRRCITALAVSTLFAGLAAAQGNGLLQCATNVSVTPQLRGEGFTEQTGDITLTCVGGNTPAVGAAIPLVNFTVFYNTAVTSRLLPVTASTNVGGTNQASEALLMIDEPGSGLTATVPGFGPGAPQNVCGNPVAGCPEVVSSVGGAFVATDTAVATTAGKNVFQGIVTGNSVTFFGVPVLAPGTAGSRTFRITNVRVNANPLAGGSASGASPVQASISISGATSLLISNPTPFVGFVTNGLTASVSGSGPSDTQCGSQTKQSVTTLRFTENFGTAFKTRVAALTNTQFAGQTGTPNQNIPGGTYNSESNIVVPIPGTTQVAGLADFGTRLKAVFNNIPAGAHVFVSTANVLNNQVPAIVPTVQGGSVANTLSGTNAVGSPYVGYAVLINGESTSDGNAVGGFLPTVSSTDTATSGSVPIVEIPISGGTGTAVWEVMNTNPNTIETFQFAAYITYVANVPQNSPPPGTSTVNLSFAPTPPSFKASDGANASSSLPIPRFIADSSAARNILTITICRTILLYPFVTNQGGFDTGIAIANTTVDPFGTGAQSGTCTMNWYGGTSTAPKTNPPTSQLAGPDGTFIIQGGATAVNTAGILVPSFQGYMIAVCNFQYAHGFAFISDVGARNLAMGYLAVVLNDPGSSSRSNTNTTTSENGGH